ncbi:MAG: 16S rRNA (adenine(1518)-N(6)/adenine(1519)-N(6))-dimethyltransferase RsmA [Oscillospiraceae bacterium]|nr:16S rRNA (adenine(1518)-N(6)/adenine(1519)-N(6))-dimethyltransferase RsmA [Oscillospiraceae bacterium]
MNDKKIKPQKSLGQNFLIDKNISAKIVKLSSIDKNCYVLEIGPGLGALTVPLAQAAGHVLAVELDTRMVSQLRDILAAFENVTVIQGDILKLDIMQTVGETLKAKNLHVCANLPYNITTPVITKLIETGLFEAVTVMIQKEVAQRICASPGTPEYGAFTVFANYHTVPEILFDVPPECFSPKPKVTSSVIKMQIRKEKRLSPDDEKLFFRTVRAAFGQRRKTLVNALHSVFESTHSKEDITKAIEGCGFDPKIRGERLSIEDFERLSKCLNQIYQQTHF